MFNIYHYHHWSDCSAIVVATSQVLPGGYTAETAAEAANVFVLIGYKKTLAEAIDYARRCAAEIGGDFKEYQSKLPTVDGSAVLFELKK